MPRHSRISEAEITVESTLSINNPQEAAMNNPFDTTTVSNAIAAVAAQINPTDAIEPELSGVVETPINDTPEEQAATEQAETQRGVLFFTNANHPDFCNGLILPYRIVLNEHFAGEPKGSIYLDTAKRLTAGQAEHNRRIQDLLHSEAREVRALASRADLIWSQWDHARMLMYRIADLKVGTLAVKDGFFVYKSGIVIAPLAKIQMHETRTRGTYRVSGLPFGADLKTSSAIVYHADNMDGEDARYITLRPITPGNTETYDWGGAVDANSSIVWDRLLAYLGGCSIVIDHLASSCNWDPTKARREDYKWVAGNRFYFKAGMSTYLADIFAKAAESPEAARLEIAAHKTAAAQARVINAHANHDAAIAKVTGSAFDLAGTAFELLPLPAEILAKVFKGHEDALVEQNGKKFLVLNGAACKLDAYSKINKMPVGQFNSLRYDPAAATGDEPRLANAASSYYWMVRF